MTQTPQLTNVDLNTFKSLPLVRNSERSSFKTCQQQWWWGWNMGLSPAMPKQDARWFGSAWHYVLAEYYTPPKGAKNGFVRGRDMHETWDEQMKFAYTTISTQPYFDSEGEKEWVDARQLGHDMITGYMEKYQGDPQWEVLMPEQRFRIKVPFNQRQVNLPAAHWNSMGIDRTKPHIAELVGTFDMPIRDHSDGHIKIVDHKTAAAYDFVLAYLVKDDQGGTYIAVGTQALRGAGLIGPDEAITGMIFNFARKAKKDVRPQDSMGRFLNKDGSISKRQPAPYFWRDNVERSKENRLRQIRRIADDVEQMQMVRNGLMGIIKSPGKHCSWCDFRDLCDIDEDGGDTEQFIKDVFKKGDPYHDHRQGAVNSKVGEQHD